MFFSNKYIVLCTLSIVVLGLYIYSLQFRVSNEEAIDFVARALSLDESLMSFKDGNSLMTELEEFDKDCINSSLSMVMSGYDHFYLFTLTSEVFEPRLIRLDYYRDQTVAKYVSKEKYSKFINSGAIISRYIELGACD